MLNKEGVMVDRREGLKVKVKSLAVEAQIIRIEERKTNGDLRTWLERHRREDVRYASRTSLMAYGLIRGRPVDVTERPGTKRTESYWKEVKQMISNYGPLDPEKKTKLLQLCVN
jgi:hypothetical protein